MKFVTVLLIIILIFILFNTSGYTDDVSGYTGGPLPSTMIWSDVAYGAGYYVAVGNNSGTDSPNIAYSTDGTNWTLGATLPQGNWNSIAFGNGTFVAGSTNSLYYTTDPTASDWTSSTINSSVPISISQIVYSTKQQKFYTAGGAPTFTAPPPRGAAAGSGSLTSNDGVNWSWIGVGLLKFPTTSVVVCPSGTTNDIVVALYNRVSSTSSNTVVSWNTNGMSFTSNYNVLINPDIGTTKMYYNTQVNTWMNEEKYAPVPLEADPNSKGFRVYKVDDNSYVSDVKQSNNPTLSVMTVACNPGGIVVKVGTNTIKYRVADTEYTVNSATTSGVKWYHVSCVNNKFFVFGVTSTGATKALYSTNGQSWTNIGLVSGYAKPVQGTQITTKPTVIVPNNIDESGNSTNYKTVIITTPNSTPRVYSETKTTTLTGATASGKNKSGKNNLSTFTYL